tara:strand:+ start:851 stop:1486 length:636 start_codon:yes stop_codon:yes gene_type:complete
MISDFAEMMIVISSPSGAGKTTLVKLLAERNNNFEISVSTTTRAPRKNEIEGKDYFFIDEDKFSKLVKTNSFYEYARVFNHLYGTLKETVDKSLSNGKHVLFDIDWQGAKQLKKLMLNYKLISIFILPPNVETLKDRLSKRDIKDKLIIKERMSQFKNDVLHWEEYDYVVINSELEECYQKILSIIVSEQKGKKLLFDKDKIKEKILELTN